MQKVIINPSYGGNESGIISGNFIEKNYNLELGKKIERELANLGVNSNLIRTDDVTLSNSERLQIINNLNKIGDEVVLVTLQIIPNDELGTQIVYSIRDNDNLARNLSDNIELAGQSVLKFYQRRNLVDTSKDYYQLIENPSNSENIILSLGNPNNSFDNSFMLNNIDKLARQIAISIDDYLTSKNIYIVQRRDTLYSIANKFNITVDDLKKANNLVNNALIVGQKLIIPKTTTTTGEDEEDDMYVSYTVQKGDSLYSIANKYNTTVSIIKDVNNLETDNLAINQVLKIPTSTISEDVNYDNYIVKKGDSLYSIANKYNTTVSSIIDLNNLTSNNLSIGQVLKILNETGSDTIEENYSLYTVKKGDTLYKIASLYQTSVNGIIDLNNLTSNNLSINQVLKIPTSKIDPNYLNYTVKSGDSLYKIATNYNTTVNALKSLNNLTSNNLSIGQILKIPV